MTSLTRAADALGALETMAVMQEEANRHATQDKRSVEHVVDSTPWPTYPRIVLHVAMLYKPFFEQLAMYGRSEVLAARNVKAHLAYAVRYEGVLLPLTRDEAVELLATRELPAGVSLPEPAAGATAAEIDALFDELAKPSIHAPLGAARRAERLLKEDRQY